MNKNIRLKVNFEVLLLSFVLICSSFCSFDVGDRTVNNFNIADSAVSIRGDSVRSIDIISLTDNKFAVIYTDSSTFPYVSYV